VKRRKSRKSEAAVVADDNVGATLELSRRHEIVVRAGIRGGQRVRSRLERLIENGDVSPEAGYAGFRYGRDWALSLARRQHLCEDLR
jgi:hypothetical protein